MRRLPPLLTPLLLSSLLLAACGSSGGEDTTSETTTAVSTDSTEVSAELVDTSNLPDFVAVYEGAKPILNMTSNENGQKGGIFTYSVNASVADVATFYRAAYKTAEIAIQTEANAQGTVALAGESADKLRSLVVTIAKGEDDQGANVSIAYGEKSA